MNTLSNAARSCKLCTKPVKGRSDKIFCSVRCKSIYARKLRAATDIATKDIDKVLHRNRSILLEVLGKNRYQLSVPKDVLDKKKFNYKCITRYHLNTKNKMIHYVYDFSWMMFSDGYIFISRLRRKNN